MQLTSIFAFVALAGSGLATPIEADTSAATGRCFNGNFRDVDVCKKNCEGGQCTLVKNSERYNDNICLCDYDSDKPGCGAPFRGKPACEAECGSGTCIQFPLPYDCNNCPGT